MRNWLRQFMLGRYGVDDLSRFMIMAALIVTVLSRIVGWAVLSSFAMVLLMLYFFRMLSRNTAARSRENYTYLQLRGKAERRIKGWKDRFRQRKTHSFFSCPSCRAQLRVPKGKGNITVTCPKCRTSFDKRT